MARSESITRTKKVASVPETTPSKRPDAQPVYGPVEQPGYKTCFYEWMDIETGMPEGFRTVIAWDLKTEMPVTAFFDDEQTRWRSQQGDTFLDDVTCWMHYLSPEGADSGSGQVRPTGAGERAAIVAPQAQPVRPTWTRAMPDSMPVGGVLAVMVWVSKSEFPYAATYDDDEKCWISQQDGERLDGVTHWSYYLPPDQPSNEPGGACYELAPEEIRLLQAYRESDDRARDAMLRLAVRQAEDWPRDWITLPAHLEEARQEAGASSAEMPSRSGHGEKPAPSLDDALDRIANESDNIDCLLGSANDLLRVALNECERAGNAACYVAVVISAARRYAADISKTNLELQHYVSVLKGE
jgi:hypothetical protein